MDPIDFHDSTSIAQLFYDFFMEAFKRRMIFITLMADQMISYLNQKRF